MIGARTIVSLAVISVALAAPPELRAQAGAQAGVIEGTAVTEGTQRPLPGVQITVAGQTGKGAVSDASGKFRITGVTGERVVLDARAIGYRPLSDTVAVGATNIRVSMSERALELNQVVVTGTAGGAEKRELGTSIASVNAAEVMAQTAVPSVDALLNGRAPGVNVLPGSGQVGAGALLRIRGVGTFSLSNQPLIYVDGIRSDNGQTGLVQRFDDFDPEQIESIEVLKGSAAATLYGTEAARGVINIITKKGAAGSNKYSFTVRDGDQWFMDAANRMATNYAINPNTGQLDSINFVKSEAAAGHPLFRTGLNQGFDGSVSGGSNLYRYYAVGQWDNETGIVTQNARTQKSARTNLSVVPNSKFDLETNVGYITSHTNVTSEGSGGGVFFTGEYAEPQRTAAFCPTPAPRGCGWARGAFSNPPEVYMATNSWQDLQRFTGSVSAKWDPFPWMSHRLLVGTDYALEDIQSYLPYQTDSVIVFFEGTGFDGSRSETTQQTRLNTYDYAGTVHFNLTPTMVSKSTFGAQYYTNTQTALSASGTHFPTPGLSTISATGTKGTPSSSFLGNNTLGFYGQQEASWSDRLFLTAALRVDNNSAFGSDASWVTYPKAAASWVASEDPRVRGLLPSAVDNLRLRIAYGASGQQPAVNSALQTLTPVAGPNGATVLTTGSVGNPDLKPEYDVETELGFEAGLLNDRIGVDFTFYNDASHDAILSKTTAPSAGFGGGSQFFNAGQIHKHGIELGLKGQVINRRSLGWDMQFNVATTHATINRLSGAPGDTIVDLGTAPPIGFRVGGSPYDYYTYNVVSATYDPTTKKALNAMCQDDHGGIAPCFNSAGATVAPKVYFGHSIPTAEGSWSNTVRVGRFRFYGLVDFERGANKFDNNLRINCQLNGDCLMNVFPQNYDPAQVAQVQNGGTLRNMFIKPASFTKLRELSVSYDASERVAGYVGANSMAITMSARNLHTWTRYTGLDPESSLAASNGTGSNSGNALDQSEFPQLAQFLVTFRLAY